MDQNHLCCQLHHRAIQRNGVTSYDLGIPSRTETGALFRPLTDHSPLHYKKELMQAETSTGRGLKYKRIILKLSGEVLKNPITGDPIDPAVLKRICSQLKEIWGFGMEVGVVVGGGNIFRGLTGKDQGVARSTGDYMGMLATVINSMALMDCLEKMGVVTRVLSAIRMPEVAEPFILRRAVRHLERGRLVIFGAGTGNPYFSTDTTAALRANEIQAEIILKATKVDGIYDKDPAKFPDARKYDELTYMQCLGQRLNVMDSTAFSLCMDNKVPIMVIELNDPEAIKKAVTGEKIGTLVHE